MYAEQLKKHRQNENLSQNELAKRTGIPQRTLNNIERTGMPNIEQCVKLADYYCISIDELIGHEIKKNWL